MFTLAMRSKPGEIVFMQIHPPPSSMAVEISIQGRIVLKVGLGRISGSAGLSGRISGYLARKSQISGSACWIIRHPEKKTDPTQPYLKDVAEFFCRRSMSWHEGIL